MNRLFAFYPNLKQHLRWLLPLVFVAAGYADVSGQMPCNPDVTPPTASCATGLTVQTNTYGPNTAEVLPFQLNNGSSDNCTPNNQLRLRATDQPGSQPPASDDLFLTGTGSVTVYLWVGDQAGNWSNCTTTITLTAPACSPDLTNPTVIPPLTEFISTQDYFNLNVDLNNDAQLVTLFGDAYMWDNCDGADLNVNRTAWIEETWLSGTPKIIYREWVVADDAGSGNVYAKQRIDVSPSYTIHCPAWHFPGDPDIEVLGFDDDPQYAFIDTAWQALIFPAACNNSVAKIEKTWNLISWVEVDQNSVATNLPALDIDQDGQTGDAYDVLIQGDSVYLLQNGQPTTPLGPRSGLYSYVQTIRYNYLDTAVLNLTGTVFFDDNGNCTFDAGETTLGGWKVKAIGQGGQLYSGLTDANGVYHLDVCVNDTLVEVSLDVPGNVSGECPSVFNVTYSQGQPFEQHVPVSLNTECALMGIDMATPILRPCRTGRYYVNYCNYSNQQIANTYVDVALDTFMTYEDASIAGTLVSGNTWRFQTGTLDAGDCGNFFIDFFLDCDAPMGMTHCSQAQIFPHDDCPGAPFWSGSDLRVKGFCEGDSVRLQVKNIGIGDMENAVDFVITEDLIIFMASSIQLNSQEMLEMKVPANGSTWRGETMQEGGHPWGGIWAAAVEGCGGLNNSGLINLFPINSPDPFQSTFCIENVSSFDPNDKQAFPVGYGSEHFVQPETDIEYMIRFQNTGTDTAFTVVLYDTLSGYLDAQNVRPGASSHTYDFDVIDGNVLRFRFDNILLPDSNVNEPASHGFVKFRAPLPRDTAVNYLVENQAAIYFDFNAPVLTNTTWHTVGENFVLVKTDDPAGAAGQLRVYPNPASKLVNLELPENLSGGVFQLSDRQGRVIRENIFSGKTCRFEKGDLPAALYFFKITAENGSVFTGKIMLQ